MPRMNEWQRDIYEGRRKEDWSLSGPKRIVKVLPYGSPASSLGGYITVGLSLLGKTPPEIERALGLRRGYLHAGARIYRFIRLPMTHEYEYELTAYYPGGLAFDPAFSNPDYPPGSPTVQQWRIKYGITIPVDPHNFLDLNPSVRFPYDWLMT